MLDIMQAVYFPLRSNGTWFQTEDARATLEARIKRASVLYETVYFENGRYLLYVWEDGLMEFHQFPESIPGDRKKISYYTPGDEASFKVSAMPDGPYQPIFEGPLLEAYEIDFYPILSEAGLLDADFVKATSPQLSSTGKAELKKRIEIDQRNQSLMDGLQGTPFQKKAILKGVHFDSLVTSDFKLPFAADPRAQPLVEFKNNQLAGEQLTFELNPATLSSLTPSAFPDFGEMDWSTIWKIRNSNAGRDLRLLIERLSKKLLESLERPDDIESLEASVIAVVG